MIPLDWKADHKNDILYRLAPNLALDPTAAPDFRTAAYFGNTARSGEDFLRLKNEAARPLRRLGLDAARPLASRPSATGGPAARTATCPKTTGWKQIAAAQDQNWSCRRKFLLVLTDGDETCAGAALLLHRLAARRRRASRPTSWRSAIENSGGDNKLTCMAANGGSGKPIYPQSKKELVKALTDIFGQIREEASAFASAAVPSVQAEVADRIYLSSFTPLNSEPVWDGHLDAYLKPLPLTDDGRPDRARVCPPAGGSQPRSSCFLWDAGEVLRTQARNIEELTSLPLDAPTLRLGPATTSAGSSTPRPGSRACCRAGCASSRRPATPGPIPSGTTCGQGSASPSRIRPWPRPAPRASCDGRWGSSLPRSRSSTARRYPSATCSATSSTPTR